MKKCFLLALLFISLAIKGYGQYVPMLNDSAVWRQALRVCHNNGLTTWCDEWICSDFSFNGDTTIESYTYKKVDDIMQEWYSYAYVREDSGKVFMRYQNEISFPYYAPSFSGPEKFLDTTEFVLYDFTLNLGDTFTTRVHKGYVNVYLGEAGDTTEYLQSFLLSDIDTVVLSNAESRRRFRFTTLDNTGWQDVQHYWGVDLEWIEGIGSTNTFFYNETGLYSDCGYDLNNLQSKIANYTLNDTLLWGVPNCQFPTSVNEVIAPEKMEVYPNPTTGIITIQGIKENADYSIYNVVGKLVKAGTTTNNQIDVGELAIGMYVLAVTENTTGKIYRSRIIKQ